MSETVLSPGDPIQARCTKCKQNTDSAVVSVVDNAPEKVQCSVCNRKHKYRPPTEAKKAAPRRVPIQVENERKQWKTLLEQADTSKAIEYSMTSSYKLKSLINHPVFGLGMVQGSAGSKKVEVLFEDGKKIMRCK